MHILLYIIFLLGQNILYIVYFYFPSISPSHVDTSFFLLQKKAKLELLEQERSRARVEKLQEEDRKISEAPEESDKLCSEVMRTRYDFT